MNQKQIASPLRQKIIQAISVLIDEGREEKVNKAVAFLQALYERFITQEPLSVDSCVFGGFVNLASSPAALCDRGLLTILREELLGIRPHWDTMSIKHDFSKLLSEEAQQLYLLVCQLYSLLKANGDHIGLEGQLLDQIDELREQLHDLCYERIMPTTIPELLVSNISQAILTLPDHYPQKFDLMDDSADFSTIYPIHSEENLQEHLDYIGDMMQKVEGNKTLFIDVTILPEAFLLNLR